MKKDGSKATVSKPINVPVADTDSRPPDEAEIWKDKYLRALADYQNLEKRTEERIRENRKFAGEQVLAELLPVVDGLDKAADHLKDRGLELVLRKLTDMFKRHQVKRIDAGGQKFDPNYMVCVEAVPREENVVVEEILPGYTIGTRILRAAKVKVGKGYRSDYQREPNTSDSEKNLI